MDRHNGDEPSLLLGVSHHTAGDLWTATPHGRCYVEINNQMIAGTTHPTSAAAILFDGPRDLPVEWREPHNHGGLLGSEIAATPARRSRLPEHRLRLASVNPRCTAALMPSTRLWQLLEHKGRLPSQGARRLGATALQ